jgi:hypothetical protein
VQTGRAAADHGELGVGGQRIERLIKCFVNRRLKQLVSAKVTNASVPQFDFSSATNWLRDSYPTE